MRSFFKYKVIRWAFFSSYRFNFYFVSDSLFRASYMKFSDIYFKNYFFNDSILYVLNKPHDWILPIAINDIFLSRFFFSYFGFFFNPVLNYKAYCLPIYLPKMNSSLFCSSRSLSVKNYYFFIKNKLIRFNLNFLTTNFIFFNYYKLVYKNSLIGNFFFNLAVVDFREVFSCFDSFVSGDYFGSADSPSSGISEFFLPNLDYSATRFFSEYPDYEIDESVFFKFDQIELFVYDDVFDYRLQNRVLSRSVYSSLLPNSFDSFSKLYLLVFSNFGLVLNWFNVPFGVGLSRIFKASVDFFSIPLFEFSFNCVFSSMKFYEWSKIVLIRQILLLIWEIYYRVLEIFVACNNSIAFLLEKFFDQRNLFEFYDFFKAKEIDLYWIYNSIFSFLASDKSKEDKYNILFVNRSDLESFLDRFLQIFAEFLEFEKLNSLFLFFIKLRDYSIFINRVIPSFSFDDPVFKTTFLVYLQTFFGDNKGFENSFFNISENGLGLKHFFLSQNFDFNFCPSFGDLVRYKGSDFTFVDNADLRIMAFEFLFRQVYSFDYFVSLEINLFALIKSNFTSGFNFDPVYVWFVKQPFLYSNWFRFDLEKFRKFFKLFLKPNIFDYPVCKFSYCELDFYKSFRFFVYYFFSCSSWFLFSSIKVCFIFFLILFFLFFCLA